MPFQPVSFQDESFKAGSGPGARYLPRGVYLMEIVDVEPSPEDHEGYPYWRWRLSVVSGSEGVAPGTGRREITTLKQGAKFSVANMLSAVGVNVDDFAKKVGTISTYDQFVRVTASVAKSVKGRRLAAIYDDDAPYNGQPASKLVSVHPADQYNAIRDQWRPQRSEPRPSVSSEIAKLLGDVEAPEAEDLDL